MPGIQACDIAQPVSQNGKNREPPPDDQTYEYLKEGEGCAFDMPVEKVPLIIGKSGETIRSLQERYGVCDCTLQLIGNA